MSIECKNHYTYWTIPNTSFFKEFIRIPLENRKKIADAIIRDYPDRIPILIDKASTSTLAEVSNHKYLIPVHMSIGEFIFKLKNSITLNPDQGIFIFIDDILPNNSLSIGSLYNIHKNEDNFLYIIYAEQNVFG